ncbi:MAG: HNH endonuclease [Okeania sp. SIO2G4]|uniref:SAVED domain-containing protein n=1 Tax=unclassified Okeania TaxID=2634635 RepID=UPI0013BA0200|nr:MULTISPECIES: SAVED domain-containing protein [unclassified Okeania]NEP72885.1 HNH endonuclease [Okeania sp. SIO2G5]NEP93672.1 HNH endonuclease [Okeania sp. SIO2F5]NEQ91596.1 HNH endonuclease [Okeania sp. SIO2G4]
MAKRKPIPETTKLQLWVKSAGRCEFKGCNTPVWYNGLTLSKGNFAEVAHIIASSKDGPRGTDQSEEMQVDFDNLMLLCKSCHKEIDDHPEKYPIELLRSWKQEHENRIEIQTNYPEDIYKSTVLVFSVNIGDRTVPINIEAVRNAMFPKFPTDTKGIKIEEQDFDRMGTPEQWQAFAETKIKRRISRYLDEGVDDVKIKHISLFGISPMPLLMYLGKCIGDTVPTDIYQSHRNIENTSKTWSWQEETISEINYFVSCEKEGQSEIVFLKLAISDSIERDKYESLLSSDCSIYQITISEPSPHFLKSKRQLEIFSYEYRKLLNEIQARHGHNCIINILPAVPVSVAVECGRVILPTKDPEIYVCEYYGNQKKFKVVLRVN